MAAEPPAAALGKYQLRLDDGGGRRNADVGGSAALVGSQSGAAQPVRGAALWARRMLYTRCAALFQSPVLLHTTITATAPPSSLVGFPAEFAGKEAHDADREVRGGAAGTADMSLSVPMAAVAAGEAVVDKETEDAVQVMSATAAFVAVVVVRVTRKLSSTPANAGAPSPVPPVSPPTGRPSGRNWRARSASFQGALGSGPDTVVPGEGPGGAAGFERPSTRRRAPSSQEEREPLVPEQESAVNLPSLRTSGRNPRRVRVSTLAEERAACVAQSFHVRRAVYERFLSSAASSRWLSVPDEPFAHGAQAAVAQYVGNAGVAADRAAELARLVCRHAFARASGAET